MVLSVGCEDVDCDDCSAGSGACVACAPGRTLLRGRCLHDGGCADGRWDVSSNLGTLTLTRILLWTSLTLTLTRTPTRTLTLTLTLTRST